MSDESNPRTLFERLWGLIAQPENYVPRDYRTVGGMWTVDRYRVDSVEGLVMDEGWTLVIRAPGLEVMFDGSMQEPKFREGDAARLAQLVPHCS